MAYSDKRLNDIFNRTDGRCHICRKKLSWSNYTQYRKRGAWEVDHSNPVANGGSDRLTNLYAACIRCNRSKGYKSTRSQRAKFGYTGAPTSYREKAKERQGWLFFGISLLAIGSIFLSGKQQNVPPNNQII